MTNLPPLPSSDNPRDLEAEAKGWASTSQALAIHTMAHLVNRDDVFGSYVKLEKRLPENDPRYMKSFTAPHPQRRTPGALGVTQARGHFAGDRVIGLHLESIDGLSRWFAFDLDCHDPQPSTRVDQAGANWHYAARLLAGLRELGFNPIVEDSDGNGGLHLWQILDAPVPTPDVYHLARQLRLEAGGAIESYPKQPQRKPNGFGNWLRLPGRHHTLPHWSRILSPNGGEWVSGASAALAWLHAPRARAWLVPKYEEAPTPHLTPHVTAYAPSGRVSGGDVGRRLAAYVAKVDHGLSDSRKRTAYRLAAALLHDFALGSGEAFEILEAWDSMNLPPLGSVAIEGLLTNAQRYGGRTGRVA